MTYVDDRTPRQALYFQDRADIYSVTRVVNPTTGKPGEEMVALVASGVPCHYVYTDNIDTRTAAGAMKEPTVLTTDKVKFTQTAPLQDKWYLVNRSILNGVKSPLYGEVHRVLGDPHVNPSRGNRLANELNALIQSIEKRPQGIPM